MSRISVNPVQKGNPLLEFLKGKVGWEYNQSIVPDFVFGASNCALFLSLAYHQLHPEYIGKRLRDMEGLYSLRVLLVLVDIKSHQQALRELMLISYKAKFSPLLAWSIADAAKYIETLKSFEFKPPDALKEHVDASHFSQLTSALTQIQHVNKTDVATLASNFTNLHQIIHATPEQLSLLPGFGDRKVKLITETFSQSFLSNS